MKKILLAFDGAHFSEGALEFVRLLHSSSPVFVTGAFLPEVNYANAWSYAAGSGGLFIPLIEEEDVELVTSNIKRFETFCSNNDISYAVHKDFEDFALPELKKETRYADLLILGSETFYENMGKEELNLYLRDALHATECPVLVVPETFELPASNILAFDAGASSVYAIKQFAYLLPELASNETILVNAKEGDGKLPDEEYISEWAAKHFSNLTFYRLGTDSRKYFSAWLSERKAAILVGGAFGRSEISTLFKKSFVSDTIKEHHIPVFIAHR
jgi:hypothetical protein